EVNEFTTGYAKVDIVRNVSINVPKGGIVSIIGRNGVGKSTLIKGIMGLLLAKKGQIILEGKNITNEKAYSRARAGIGYSPQGHGVFPNLTVEENIKMGESINEKRESNKNEVMYNYFPIIKERRKQRAG